MHLLIIYYSEDGKRWTILNNTSSLSEYSNQLTSFLACVLRTLSSTTSYQFPLTPQQKEYGQLFQDKLTARSQEDLSDSLHTFLYSLIGVPVEDSDANQWLCPLTCWLAISSVYPDGKFREPHHHTPLLARWKYHLRCIHLYQAVQQVKIHSVKFTEYIFSFYILEIYTHVDL